MKKILIAMTAVMIIIFALSACNSGGSGKTSVDSGNMSVDSGNTSDSSKEETCEIVLQKASATVVIGETLNYDFNSLFTVTVDGNKIAITDEMVETNLKDEVGEYYYRVSYKDKSATLTIEVVGKEYEVYPAYSEYRLSENEIETFDYTGLFWLYYGNDAVEVTEDMLDISDVNGKRAGDSAIIKLSFEKDGKKVEQTANIIIVKVGEIVINGHNIEIFPNSDYIDVRTLFEVTKDGVKIPVTNEMISGTINYAKLGENVLNCTYEGKSATATVTVKGGVVIDYANGDKVTVRKGTDKSEYRFQEDFILVINGIRFKDFEYMIDKSNVNFNEIGEYTATLKVDFSNKPPSLSGVGFTPFTKDITYVVSENEYEYRLKSDLVEVNANKDYYVFNNIDLKINGIKQAFTDNKDWVTSMDCYAEVKKGIDYTNFGVQTIDIDLYVNGVDNEPISVSYNVLVKTDIIIEVNDRIAFVGATIYPDDLFKIVDGGEVIPVTMDMVSGKVNTFKTGFYDLELTYKNIKKVAHVYVGGDDLKGVYKTGFTTFASSMHSTADDPDEVFVPEKLPDLVIGEKNGVAEIKLGENEIRITEVLGDGEYAVAVKNYEYIMTSSDGIITLKPMNDVHINLSNEYRPYIYVNENIWTLSGRFTVNSNKIYVLSAEYNCYSIDILNMKRKSDNSKYSFGMRVEIVEKLGSDYYYDIRFGKVNFAEDFKNQPALESYLDFDGERYDFKVNVDSIAHIIKKSVPSKYYKNYKSKIDGKDATLYVSDSSYRLKVNGESEDRFNINSSQIGTLKNGGINEEDDTLLVYYAETGKTDIEKRENFYSYKFKLNPDNKTFTYIKPDKLIGLYINDNSYIYIDGYGSGYLCPDITSYEKKNFTYTFEDNVLDLVYIDARPSFDYGSGARLYIDEFLNVLTARDFIDTKGETKFENIYITDGAIVKIDKFCFGKNLQGHAEDWNSFWNAITIITKDGMLDVEAKKGVVEKKNISFTETGFYDFKISIKVDGKTIEKPYAIEVLDCVFEGKPYVGYFHGLTTTTTINIDEYAMMTAHIGNNAYKGLTTIDGDKIFATLYSENGNKVKVTGEIILDGTIKIRLSGSENLVDCYTLDKKNTGVVGCKDFVLRYFEKDGKTAFMISKTANEIGNKVEVEFKSGSFSEVGAVLEIKDGDKTIEVKVLDWNNPDNGLEILNK